MKRDLKSEILDTAGRLFDESGGNAVSMRSIADALGISVGNLTYHYKRKEDLIEAVMRARHERCKALPPPSDLGELDGFFRSILERRSQGMMLDIRDKEEARQVQRLHRLVICHIGELLTGALDALEAAGLLRPDPARDALEQALLGMLLFCRPAELLDGKTDPQETRRCLWQLLSLLLTEKGTEDLRKIL